MQASISALDWTIVAVYFILIFSIAYWAINQEVHARQDTANYFLAGRNVGWFVVGTSLFASNIGSEHLIGLAGTGAESGLVFGQLELQASLILLVLGWFFVPFYIKSGVYTMPEFLERRYSASARWFISIVAVIGYVLTKISVTIYAGGVVFESLMGINFWTGALIVVLITGIYTILGGLRAVVYTDMIQAIVLITGGITVTVIGLTKLGGWHAMVETAGSEYFNIWKPMSHPDFPWTGLAFGAPIIGFWYWCTDQYIVQRTLSAHGIDDARRGTILAGYLKQLPMFIFVIPGVVAYCLAKKGLLELAAPDQALPTLVAVLLPTGLKGLVIAGLIAALMSSLSSVFNSCSSIFTLDIYQKLRPNVSQFHLVVVGQIATVVLVLCGLLWIPLMKNISGTLYQYLQSVQAYISPPIAAVFLLGLFFQRLNAYGAMAALVTGFVLGMGRLIAEVNKEHLDGLLYQFADINFLHMAIFLFLICSVVMLVVSLITPPPVREEINDVTYSRETMNAMLASDSDKVRRKTDKVLSIGLILIVIFIMIYFTG